MNNNISEIKDLNFFFATDGDKNPKSEMFATIEAFFSNEKKDDNSSICRFPARYQWLKDKLNGVDFPKANCIEYNKVFKHVDPQSATLVFPSAHINSPASMFGHTFIRINSSYNSKLLSYAINYAANADKSKENGVVFAIKGLTGGYLGKYSLLPYYDKLKEYRDSEQRDIWEYDLNLTRSETRRMFRHIWELNNIQTNYYFFTQNCSYEMLWLLEVARPSIELRKEFTFQVIPFETVHEAKKAGLIKSMSYRPSKRAKLLKYETLINKKFIEYPILLVDGTMYVKDIMQNKDIPIEQKRYILEASIEYLEYSFSKSKVKKKYYLELFHKLTTNRAKLGLGEKIEIKTPPNPIQSHKAVRTTFGIGSRENNFISYLGIRPAYHDLEDSNYGFLRGTQIEFLNFMFSYSKEKLEVEDATILSIFSLAQRDDFFHNISWRTSIGWDRDYLSTDATFHTSVGAGSSWGNELGFVYMMVDPSFYNTNEKVEASIGGSVGFTIDKYKFMNTKVEATQKKYTNGEEQTLIEATQGFRTSQNRQIMLKYKYKKDEQNFQILFHYYF
ncbi:MAG TPA: DUF4105 domain-containing protein [Bacteroidetes bacterium]|nr:DUF4105 domain-containing protein [Bacteroidota bacterium]